MFRILVLLMLSVPAFAQMTATQKQDVPFVSIIPNSGFENGRAGYTESGGTFLVVNSGSNLLNGLGSVTWDSNAASQTLRSPQVAVPQGLRGKNGQLFCSIKPASTPATHVLELWDGTTGSLGQTIVVADTSTAAITSINFVFPTSGNIGWRLRSVASNEPLIAIDDCYLGPATNLSSVAQATLVASAFKAGTTNCSWTLTSTTFTDFGTDTDCPALTVDVSSGIGSVVTIDDDLPQIVINNLPPGTYKVTATFIGASLVASNQYFRLSDGTTGRGEQDFTIGASAAANYALSATFTYATAGNRTFKVQARQDSGATFLGNDNANRRLQFIIERIPSVGETVANLNTGNYDWTAFTPTTQGFGTTTSNECFHARDGGDMLIRCKLTTGTVTATEARLTLPNGLTSKSSSFIPTIQLAGQWARGAASASNYGSILIEPGVTYVTFGAVYAAAANPFTKLNGSGVSASTELLNIVARVPIAEWTSAQNVPVLVGSVSSNSVGAERIERAAVTSTCSGSTCTVSSQSGSWVTSITRDGLGDYNLNIASGIFTSAPVCLCQSQNNVAAICYGFDNPSTSLWQFRTLTSGGGAADAQFSIVCMGPR